MASLLLGVVVLGEPFTLGIGIGFPLILLGCFFATARNRPPREPATDSAAERVVLAEPLSDCPSG